LPVCSRPGPGRYRGTPAVTVRPAGARARGRVLRRGHKRYNNFSQLNYHFWSHAVVNVPLSRPLGPTAPRGHTGPFINLGGGRVLCTPAFTAGQLVTRAWSASVELASVSVPFRPGTLLVSAGGDGSPCPRPALCAPACRSAGWSRWLCGCVFQPPPGPCRWPTLTRDQRTLVTARVLAGRPSAGTCPTDASTRTRAAIRLLITPAYWFSSTPSTVYTAYCDQRR